MASAGAQPDRAAIQSECPLYRKENQLRQVYGTGRALEAVARQIHRVRQQLKASRFFVSEKECESHH